MERRKFTREFKLEAAKLIWDRGVGQPRPRAIWVCTRRYCAVGWCRSIGSGIAGFADIANHSESVPGFSWRQPP